MGPLRSSKDGERERREWPDGAEESKKRKEKHEKKTILLTSSDPTPPLKMLPEENVSCEMIVLT